jgi:hypothetical protein
MSLAERPGRLYRATRELRRDRAAVKATCMSCGAREHHLSLLGHRSPRVSERGLGAGCARRIATPLRGRRNRSGLGPNGWVGCRFAWAVVQVADARRQDSVWGPLQRMLPRSCDDFYGTKVRRTDGHDAHPTSVPSAGGTERDPRSIDQAVKLRIRPRSFGATNGSPEPRATDLGRRPRCRDA